MLKLREYIWTYLDGIHLNECKGIHQRLTNVSVGNSEHHQKRNKVLNEERSTVKG